MATSNDVESGIHDAARTTRRTVLQRAMGVAAAGAAGMAGAAMVAPATALATNGDPIAAGQLTLAETTTHVKYDGAASFGGIVLLANDSSYSSGSTTFPAACGGWAGAGATAGAGGVKNGVYGYTDAGDGYAVVGLNNATTGSGGAGVYGYAGSADAVGVRAVGNGAAALEVIGSATFSSTASIAGAASFGGRTTFTRSGRANVAKGKSSVDVTVPGGLGSTANVLATLQVYRSGVYVAACRRDYPTAGKVRIYLNKVASASASTPVAWFVTG